MKEDDDKERAKAPEWSLRLERDALLVTGRVGCRRIFLGTQN